jgi:hypothetical protein
MKHMSVDIDVTHLTMPIDQFCTSSPHFVPKKPSSLITNDGHTPPARFKYILDNNMKAQEPQTQDEKLGKSTKIIVGRILSGDSEDRYGV